jgi:hypothetical protein
MFNLAIDSKLRACDLIGLRVNDVTMGSQIRARAVVMQRKTDRTADVAISPWAQLRPSFKLGHSALV